MSRRLFTISRPFTEGYVSDLPPELLAPRMAARLDNYIFPRGFCERRRGWAFDGTAEDRATGTSVAVARARFARQAVTRTVVFIDDAGAGRLGAHQAAAAMTEVYASPANAGDARMLPRAMYRDELIFCCQDGLRPLHRYAGQAIAELAQAATAGFAAGESRVTGLPANPAGTGLGGFLATVPVPSFANALMPGVWARLLRADAAATEVTLEGVRASAATSGPASTVAAIRNIAVPAPCVAVHEAGTYTTAGGAPGAVTGQGSKWGSTENVDAASPDAFMVNAPVGAASVLTSIDSVTNDTSMSVWIPAQATPQRYKILRRMPFKDAAVFRGCFWGAGVKQYPNRAYYMPPGADLGLWPRHAAGALLDPGAQFTSTNPELDYEMEFVAVPSDLDGDPIVALLATDTALLIPKRGSLWRVTGDYPDWAADKVADGAGCLDIRSAITDEEGAFWAGDDGVFTTDGMGRPVNLCGSRDRPGISTEWGNLVREGFGGVNSTSWIVLGVAEGHLLVSVRTTVGTERLFARDLRAGVWCGKFTNTVPRFLWSSRVPGEQNKLFGVMDSDARRVVELSPMFRTAVAGAQAGPAVDGDGVAPLGVAHTGSRVFFPESVTREYRLRQLKLAARAYDTATPSTTTGVAIVYGDQVDATGPDATETLPPFTADTSDAVRVREYRPGTRGRRQQLRIEQTGQDAEFAALEIHELSGSLDTFGGER